MDAVRLALYEVEGKGGRKKIRELATEYDRMTLGHEIFPEECLEFILELLSTEALFSKAGIDAFLIKLSTDMDKLSVQQKEKLLNVIRNNYCNYSDLELCWVVGDMVARYYDRKQAMNFFRDVFGSAGKAGKEGVVLGLDVVAKHSGRDAKVMQDIDNILK
ncbi:hypothetical protein [Pseudomonas sp. NPDC089734]|uniref:hypothetical protein n=1 Tax=Pseudomonas sp. NPDC089734 TaxID=3364469 RepID=UPI0038070104